MQRRQFLRRNTCCAATLMLLGGCSNDDDVHITETWMKVVSDEIVIGVWVTNPRDEEVVPAIHVEADVEDGNTYADSGELSIDPESNASRDFRLEASWEISAPEVSYGAWLSGVNS